MREPAYKPIYEFVGDKKVVTGVLGAFEYKGKIIEYFYDPELQTAREMELEIISETPSDEWPKFLTLERHVEAVARTMNVLIGRIRMKRKNNIWRGT